MKTIQILTMIAVAMIAVNSCFALGTDRDQPINIQSDSAIVDEKNGVSTYLGNVTVDQGTLHISADKVEVYATKSEVLRIIASSEPDSGTLAHYEQQPDDKPLVVAEARKIIYLVQDEQLQLLGAASLTQTRDRSFTGETISYDVTEGRVSAESEGEGRVQSTFIP
ncbi:MAG: lipopolysaccharide transport periplasmic protein LptA, partial [Pseudomonadales bacterium]